MLFTDEQKTKYDIARGELQALLRAATGRKIVLNYYVDSDGLEWVEIFDANAKLTEAFVSGDSTIEMACEVLREVKQKL